MIKSLKKPSIQSMFKPGFLLSLILHPMMKKPIIVILSRTKSRRLLQSHTVRSGFGSQQCAGGGEAGLMANHNLLSDEKKNQIPISSCISLFYVCSSGPADVCRVYRPTVIFHKV